MSTVKIKNDEPALNEAITGLVESLQDNSEDAKASFSIESELREGFQSTVNVRGFEFYVDEPEELGGKNSGPNPIEYLLGSLAACQEITAKAHAQLLGISINSVKVEAKGELDLQGFLNITDKRPGFESIEYHTVIDTDESNPDKLNLLKERVDQNCPVLDIIQSSIQSKGSVSYVD